MNLVMSGSGEGVEEVQPAKINGIKNANDDLIIIISPDILLHL